LERDKRLGRLRVEARLDRGEIRAWAAGIASKLGAAVPSASSPFGYAMTSMRHEPLVTSADEPLLLDSYLGGYDVRRFTPAS
jgi:hypothetical protein